MLRVALYIRVSTERQSTENQLAPLQEFARASGWTIVQEYNETVSGSGKKARPEFDALMLAASQKQFDIVLFWALDRLSREGISKTLGYLEQLKTWGVGWRSFTQPFLNSADEMVSGIVLAVLSAVAKQERISISERTKAGLVKARKAGKQLGRPSVGVDMAQVRSLRDHGYSIRQIAEEMGCSASLLAGKMRADARDGLLARIGEVSLG